MTPHGCGLMVAGGSEYGVRKDRQKTGQRSEASAGTLSSSNLVNNRGDQRTHKETDRTAIVLSLARLNLHVIITSSCKVANETRS